MHVSAHLDGIPFMHRVTTSNLLNEAFEEAKTCKGKPTVIIADTIKGYGGGEIMENKADWHHKVPTQEMYETISAELLKRRDAANE